jgi:ribosome biogenesis GTPase
VTPAARRGGASSFDEDDVRVRAGRPSRRRTKEGPAFAEAREAVVVAVDRGRYTCRLLEPDPREDAADATPGWGRVVPGAPPVVCVRGGPVRRVPLVVGDRVSVDGDVRGQADTLARIVRLADRRTVLRRTPEDDETTERPVVANADLLVIVTALADPPARPRMVDRCLVAAFDGGLMPLLCLTKADLPGTAPVLAALIAAYEPLGVPVIATSPAPDDPGVAALVEQLTGRVSVLFGHSGVGKSTLVNRIVPGTDRSTGIVSGIGRGRHTTSSAVALRLPDGDGSRGWVVDTPGVRSLGLGAVSPDRVVAAFTDLAPGLADCPPGCTHRADSPGCGLDAWVERSGASRARLDSLRRLLASREGDREAGGGRSAGARAADEDA